MLDERSEVERIDRSQVSITVAKAGVELTFKGVQYNSSMHPVLRTNNVEKGG